MTRTARAAFPRAIIKDRSESRSGLDKSIRKGGAGAHSWGNIADEWDHERAAIEDERLDMDTNERPVSDDLDSSSESLDEKKPINGSLSEAELEVARQFRKNALKGSDLDLSAIARTSSAVPTSPKGNISTNIVL